MAKNILGIEFGSDRIKISEMKNGELVNVIKLRKRFTEEIDSIL